MANKYNVFVITPFNDDFLALYDYLKTTFSENFNFTNAGDLDNQQNIIKDIVTGIANADVIIADLTGLNANVFYELGLAHAMNKKVIIITQDIDELPFDIKSYRANGYSLQFNKIPQLIDELTKLLNGAVDGSISYGNPVADYVPNYNFTINQCIAQAPSVEESDKMESIDETLQDEEDGLLDYIADITESAGQMQSEITAIGSDMEHMSSSVKIATEKITVAKNKSGGNSDPSFTRNICRKVSEPIGEYASKLKEHIDVISGNWGIIENAYLKMLDNSKARQKANMQSLRDSEKEMTGLQMAIRDSNVKIDGLIMAMQSCKGMERRLNRAVDDLIREFGNYQIMTETILASIDRIKSKNNIVISELMERP